MLRYERSGRIQRGETIAHLLLYMWPDDTNFRLVLFLLVSTKVISSVKYISFLLHM